MTKQILDHITLYTVKWYHPTQPSPTLGICGWHPTYQLLPLKSVRVSSSKSPVIMTRGDTIKVKRVRSQMKDDPVVLQREKVKVKIEDCYLGPKDQRKHWSKFLESRPSSTILWSKSLDGSRHVQPWLIFPPSASVVLEWSVAWSL